jgi:uncharacterized protein (UPF0261 family)
MALRQRAFRQDESRPVICASMFDVTTPCVTHSRQLLEELGYEVLVFHQVDSRWGR